MRPQLVDAHPRRSQGQRVAALLHEPQGRQLRDDRPVDGRPGVEPEVGEALGQRPLVTIYRVGNWQQSDEASRDVDGYDC